MFLTIKLPKDFVDKFDLKESNMRVKVVADEDDSQVGAWGYQGPDYNIVEVIARDGDLEGRDILQDCLEADCDFAFNLEAQIKNFVSDFNEK